MPACPHTSRPLKTLTLSLPTGAGVYEALIVYRCAQCRRVDAYNLALRNDRPMPTWAEVTRVQAWQQAHPRAAHNNRQL